MIKIKGHIFRFVSRLLEKFGYFIIKDRYYCPIPNKRILAAEVDRWWKPSELIGLRLDVERMEQLLREIAKYKKYLQNLPKYEEVAKKGSDLVMVQSTPFYYLV